MPLVQAQPLMGKELIPILLLDHSDGPTTMQIKQSYQELFLYHAGKITCFNIYDYYKCYDGLCYFYRVAATIVPKDLDVFAIIQQANHQPYCTYQDMHAE